MALVDRVVPPPSDEMLDRALDAAMSYVAAQGVTSVHHMGGWTDLDALTRAHRAGRLRTRVYAAVPLSDWERLRDRVAASGRGDAWLRIGLLKGFVDGSLGSKTALFDDPYPGSGDDRGLAVTTPEQLRTWITGADHASLHVAVHAIGDRANRELLDIYDAGLARPRRARSPLPHRARAAPGAGRHPALRGPGRRRQHAALPRDRRWAVGGTRHRPLTHPDDVRLPLAARRGRSGGVRVGLVRRAADAARGHLRGSHAADAGRRQSGGVGAGAEGHRRGGACAPTRPAGRGPASTRPTKGVLAAGRLADLVVLDRDIRTMAPSTIREARVTTTIVGGRVVFEAP